MVLYKKERIRENRLLSKAEVRQISLILGREYESIRWIRHTLFGVAGATCVMRTKNLNYTEAFAGSGEFAVVRRESRFEYRPPNS